MRRSVSSIQRFVGIAICVLALIPAGCGAPAPIEGEADYDVIVVGGGLGGLSAGTHLALNGLRVLLLEQHDKVGGCASRFERADFTFEASLHEMAGGGPGRKDRGLYRLLQHTGVGEKVELYELPDFYRSVFPGVDITLPNNWEDFKETLKARWPEEAEGIDTFHQISSGTLQDLISLKDLFRYRGLRALWVKALAPFRQPTFFKYKDRTFQQVLDECFQSEDLKAVIAQLWTYYGPPPGRQSAIIALAATDGYLTDGIWHVKGTSQELSNAYAERITELGGEVKTNTLVTGIVVQNGIATGVETASGETYSGRYVVANTDPYQLAFELVGERHFPADYVERLRGLKPGNSLFGVYLGLNVDLKELGYRDTEIFYNTSRDEDALYDNMMQGDLASGAVVVTIYSNYGDPVYAPPGKSVVTVTAYSDMALWPEDRQEYDRLKSRKADELLALAARVIPELANPEVIEVKEGFTPRTIARFTRNRDGIVYGFDISPEQMMKVPNDTPIDNIYIASNWSQAWHGMGAVQVNGWRAARLILDREGL